MSKSADERSWSVNLKLVGSVALVSIVFSFVILLAPCCGAASSIPDIVKFMKLALLLVFIENLCVIGVNVYMELETMNHEETLKAYAINTLMDTQLAAKEAHACTDEFASVASTQECM